MNTNLSNSRNKRRQEAMGRLRAFLSNPGKFSILLLGEPGTGKSYLVQQIQKELTGKIQAAGGLIEISLAMAEPTKEYWSKAIQNAEGKILLIENLEMIKPHENLVFELLSTSNGKYGFEEKNIETRVVFTSSYDVSAFRINEDIISHKLFDRVAQLVVKLPSFADADSSIWSDFEATWQKMKFEEMKKVPGNDLKDWLEGHGESLNGNFRDLDKIAILWHQFRLMGLNEGEILKAVLDQFQLFSSFPKQHTETGDVFYFKKGKTKEEIDAEFKATFKQWVKKTYGSYKAASGELKMSHRTLEKY